MGDLLGLSLCVLMFGTLCGMTGINVVLDLNTK
jgi:hypothetical protein